MLLEPGKLSVILVPFEDICVPGKVSSIPSSSSSSRKAITSPVKWDLVDLQPFYLLGYLYTFYSL